ncbi:MAG: hypothetical protein ACE37H_11600 [Phycisphaeraceae bacterium]
MQMIQQGQCGMCTHFGEGHEENDQLVQIRTSKQAPEDYVDTCGKNDDIHLKVTPLSGCDGFEPVAAA